MGKPSLQKAELVDRVAKETGLTKVAVESVINSMQNTIVEAVTQGKKVTLPRFVSFVPQIRKERKQINPRTGKQMIVAESPVVRIHPLQHVRDSVASGKVSKK